ncbi:hypothetical protein HK096_006862 [Nowakowskiella sp. JEL0078]|nr:hypothetical protein HK096_006862 [Nowakowskiella sp. JEL0078]
MADYFNSYQGGVYAKDGVCTGWLIDTCSTPRDFFNYRVIISHAGGGRIKVDGEWKLSQSQKSMDRGVRPMIEAYLRKSPVMVILGRKKVGAYIVLGWYIITHVWPEKNEKAYPTFDYDYSTRYKFRAQLIEDTNGSLKYDIPFDPDFVRWNPLFNNNGNNVENAKLQVLIHRRLLRVEFVQRVMLVTYEYPRLPFVSSKSLPGVYNDTSMQMKPHYGCLFLSIDSEVKVEVRCMTSGTFAGHIVVLYVMPNGSWLQHVLGGMHKENKTKCSVLGDLIFEQLQKDAEYLPFERRQHKQHQGGEALPMDKAPKSIICSKKILQGLNGVFGIEFNELLAVLYLSGQKMGFHNDGETGVQHTVSSFSLGLPSTMSFAYKRSKGDQRHGSKFLEIALFHGDIISMCGTDFQRDYVHSVNPIGFRFAITSRQISKGFEMTLLNPYKDEGYSILMTDTGSPFQVNNKVEIPLALGAEREKNLWEQIIQDGCGYKIVSQGEIQKGIEYLMSDMRKVNQRFKLRRKKRAREANTAESSNCRSRVEKHQDEADIPTIRNELNIF